MFCAAAFVPHFCELYHCWQSFWLCLTLFLLPVFYELWIEFMIIRCLITDKLLPIWRTEIKLFYFSSAFPLPLLKLACRRRKPKQNTDIHVQRNCHDLVMLLLRMLWLVKSMWYNALKNLPALILNYIVGIIKHFSNLMYYITVLFFQIFSLILKVLVSYCENEKSTKWRSVFVATRLVIPARNSTEPLDLRRPPSALELSMPRPPSSPVSDPQAA